MRSGHERMHSLHNPLPAHHLLGQACRNAAGKLRLDCRLNLAVWHAAMSHQLVAASPKESKALLSGEDPDESRRHLGEPPMRLPLGWHGPQPFQGPVREWVEGGHVGHFE